MDERDPKRDAAALAALHGALLQLAAHSQDNKIATLYNLLVSNSIIILAWAAIFAGHVTLPRAVACTFLALVGALSAVVWYPLGHDYANASDLYSALVGTFEAGLPAEWPKPLVAREQQRNEKGTPAFFGLTVVGVRSRDLLLWAPRCLALLHGAFLVLTWWAWYMDGLTTR